MHLAPWRVVADRHRRIDDVPGTGQRAGIVLRHRTQHHRVRQRQLLAHSGADARREHAEPDHRTLVIRDAHVLARPIGPRVHQDQSARRLRDDARCADRHHEANEHRHAFERVGLRAGKMRIGHRDREQPHGDLDEAPGRPRGIGVDPVERQPTLLHAVEEAAQHPVRDVRDREDRDGDHQSGERAGDCREHPDERLDEERRQAFAPRPRIWEAMQDVAQPLVGEQQRHDPERDAQHGANRLDHTLALDDLGSRGVQFPALGLGVAEQAARDRARHPEKEPQGGEPDQRGDCRPSGRGKQRAGVARLLHLGDRLVEPAHGVGGERRLGNFTEAIGIVVGHGKGDVAVDPDDDALRRLLARHCMLAGSREQPVDARRRVVCALLDRHAEQRDTEANDRPVEDDDLPRRLLRAEQTGLRTRGRVAGIGRTYRRRHDQRGQQHGADDRRAHSPARAVRDQAF